MRLHPIRPRAALTFIEVLVVIAVLLALAVLALPFFAGTTAKSPQMVCVNNLHHIGIAYRTWAGDHGDKFPTEESSAIGGWADLLTKANQGANCWTNYAILAAYLGDSPKVLICPADERRPAKDFKDFKDNTHLSYFVGVGSDDYHPTTILGGDRNLGPGVKPDPDYGFSPKDGKGNDVAVPIPGPVSWSLKMHSRGNPGGAGDIMLGDGSQQKTSSAVLIQFLANAGPDPTTNWPAGLVPASPFIRLIFP
jgi:type II secretory pathway pseudopilin PulG